MKRQFFMDVAQVAKNYSTCRRLHVGAVLVNSKTGRVLCTGYNGTPSGIVNCKELFSQIDDKFIIQKGIKVYLPEIADKCTRVYDKDYFIFDESEWKEIHHMFSERFEIHAEPNAIFNLYKDGTNTKTEDLELYVTTAPCPNCLKTISGVGIKKVYYEDVYDRVDINEINNLAKTLNVALIQISKEENKR